MNDVKTILKSAFIDSQIDSIKIASYDFSHEFELKMQQHIKYQKGIRKLLNTTVKRVACIFLAIFICLGSVACSIKEVREPIIDEIQKFFVNAKEILSGTKADGVSEMFPTDVTKIIGTSYISESKNQYVIDGKKEVTDFIKLLSETYWGEPELFNDFDEINTYWCFDFFNSNGDVIFKIKMCNDISSNRAKIVLVKGKTEKKFYISNKVYKEILAFTNRKFYLHDSPIDEINNEFFENQKVENLYGLDEVTARKVKESIRRLHYQLESFLMSNVSLLKEEDSIYWEYVLNEEIFEDPITKTEKKYDIKHIVIHELEYIINAVKENQAKERLNEALNIWKQSIEEHSLEGCFEVHKYVHDYDYFAFNYPTRYVYSEFADYQGVDDYFGILNQ